MTGVVGMAGVADLTGVVGMVDNLFSPGGLDRHNSCPPRTDHSSFRTRTIKFAQNLHENLQLKIYDANSNKQRKIEVPWTNALMVNKMVCVVEQLGTPHIRSRGHKSCAVE